MSSEKRVHLVGIGGSGMSGLATVLLAKGASVSGSDLEENAHTIGLRSAGVRIDIGQHDARRIRPDLDRVIVSSAVTDQNAEVLAANAHRIPVVRRLEAVAGLLQDHRSIGVAGTHGKTTTSAMASTILDACGRDPSYLIGAHCPGLGGNARLGRGDWFVAEIDESDGLLVSVETDVSILTNVGRDHLQTYADLEAICRVFAEYVERSRHAVLAIDDPHARAIAETHPGALTVGLHKDARLRAENLRFDRFETTFDLVSEDARVDGVVLPAPGAHNVRNALCAVGAAFLAGVDLRDAAWALRRFVLPHRRFELLEENGVTVVDDYAHLPEEIEATLDAVRSGWPDRRILVVFQPHRYSRTQAIGSEFGRAFSLADTVIVTPIYPACEAPIAGVTSQIVVDAVSRETRAEVRSTEGVGEAIELLKSSILPGDFILSFGAGDVWRVTERLASFLIAGQFCIA